MQTIKSFLSDNGTDRVTSEDFPYQETPSLRKCTETF